jgi:hypothetical protein
MLSEAQRGITALASAMRASFEALAADGPVTLKTIAPLADILERLEGLPVSGAEIARAILDTADIPRVLEALQAGVSWREAYDAAASSFVEGAFAASVAHLRAPLAAGSRSFFARWGSGYRGASRELAGLLREHLPKRAAERVERVDRLTAVASLKADWERDQDYCYRTFGDTWRGEKTDFSKLFAIAAWCANLSRASFKLPRDKHVDLIGLTNKVPAMRGTLRETASVARDAISEVVTLLDLDPAVFGESDFEAVDLDVIAARFGAMAGATNRYSSWAHQVRLQKTLISAGLSELEERMRFGNLFFDGYCVVLG